MLKKVLTIGVFAGALFGAGPGEVRIDVPFSFAAGKEKLPAGQYRITTEATNGGSYWLTIRSKMGAMFLAPVMRVGDGMAGKSEVVFACESQEQGCRLKEVASPNGPRLQVMK